ncbi:MAG: prepilin-type N-terminal cleavage/methylation domain-containing protein [Gemmatimonadota bacterium]|jgi:prepilin-type N-terminal cleavage/methylation domain-containing protein
MEHRRGFTLIEVVVVISVGAALLTLAVAGFGGVRSRYAVREARASFAALHARTRAHAIEFGQTVELHADAAGDSIWIERNDTILEAVRLGNELGVDLLSDVSVLTLCINSRGYGDSGCSSFSAPLSLYFAAVGDTARLEVFPLGQLRYAEVTP